MIRTQIQIHSEQLKWLKHQAVGNGVSMSQMIRDSIDFYRTHFEKTRRLKSTKKLALSAVGSFSSDPGQTLRD